MHTPRQMVTRTTCFNVTVMCNRSRLATLAAIRGACPAGGCAISLCCDARIMTAGNGTIGLNEVALGIPVPKYWVQVMAQASRVEGLLRQGSGLFAEAQDELSAWLIAFQTSFSYFSILHCFAPAWPAFSG